MSTPICLFFLQDFDRPDRSFGPGYLRECPPDVHGISVPKTSSFLWADFLFFIFLTFLVTFLPIPFWGSAFFACCWKLPAYSGACYLQLTIFSFLLTFGAFLFTILAFLLTVEAFLLTVENASNKNLNGL